MPAEIFVLLGGIGLFLYGMQALTAELKVMVTDRARGAIRRYAGRPVPGMAVGAGLTAIIQSSSATLVMTLGFVGAGVLTFTQSLGIILGANVGTTFTGWMVMLFGVKINLGLIAFAVLFFAGLLRIIFSGAIARLGGVVSGLALIFIGIDLMQDGMEIFDGLLTPETLPADTLWGRLQLLGLGVVVTVITQSSSAGIAATIVLLAEGHLTFTQAAALAIGTTVGTTFTGILASIAGTNSMRRAALANLVFNMTKGIIALLLLDGIARLLAAGGQMQDPTVALVVFHTGFTVIGALLFLPIIGPFGRLIERLLPERKQPIERELDPRFLSDPSAALDITLSVLRRHVCELSAYLGHALRPGVAAGAAGGAVDPDSITRELDAVGEFLSKLNLPDRDRLRLERRGDLMSLIDHMRRLLHRAGQSGRITVAVYEPSLHREAMYLGAILRRIVEHEGSFVPGDPDAALRHAAVLSAMHARLQRSVARMTRREERLRRRVLASRAAPPRLFALTDSIRWLRRSNTHVERVLHHLGAAEEQAFSPAPYEPEAEEQAPPEATPRDAA